MGNNWFAVLDMAIVGIPVLLFGTYQLWSVNREIAKDRAAAAEKARSAEGAGHPVGQHGLDDGRGEAS